MITPSNYLHKNISNNLISIFYLHCFVKNFVTFWTNVKNIVLSFNTFEYKTNDITISEKMGGSKLTEENWCHLSL